jgi:DNA-binding CsgD family transcriptional regulator
LEHDPETLQTFRTRSCDETSDFERNDDSTLTAATLIKLLDLVMRGETILLAGLLPSTDASDDEQEAGQRVINDNKVPEDPLLLLESNVPEVSTREKCILRCLILGDSNKAIARKMDIAEATVKVHIKAILRKIRAHNRTQAAIWAMNNASWVRVGEDGVDAAGGPARSAAPARVPALLEGQKLRSGISRQGK